MVFNFQEFKPSIFFLLKFVGLYILLSVIYGLYIESVEPLPDWATISVTKQAANLVSLLGWTSDTSNHPTMPTTTIYHAGKAIVSVYEGCNGINVGIIFICFMIAFGSYNRKLIWFSLGGLIFIHLINLLRIVGLFWVVIYLPNAVYFTHKYLFTAIIYAAVFLVWLVWIRVNFKRST